MRVLRLLRLLRELRGPNGTSDDPAVFYRLFE